MALNRRDILKFPLLAMAATTIDAKNERDRKKPYSPIPLLQKLEKPLMPPVTKPRIVIVGGGFGGLTVAKKLKIAYSDAEVIVLDKREIFMTGPMFNLMLGGIDRVRLDTIIHDRMVSAAKYGYRLIAAEVIDIDRRYKHVYTTKGIVDYTFLVLSPGIAYDYEKQFPHWDSEKITLARTISPAGLIPGEEFLTLLHNLHLIKEGNIIVTVPMGKYRCPPAPYERACMFANYIRKHRLKAKVIIIDSYSEPVSKTPAFKEAFHEVYPDIIEYYGDSIVTDVDYDNKVIHFDYWGPGSGDDGTSMKKSFSLLNLIPNNKANPVIEMANIKTLAWGSAVLKAPTYQSVTDEDIYVVGDCVGYSVFPESGQMANSMGTICAKHIALRLQNRKFDPTKDMPGNICISMIQSEPDRAISESHAITYKNGKWEVEGYIPFDKSTKQYRSPLIAQTLFDWYDGIMEDILG
ncbi:NAD(P)/FAD-dependent oxidoreductase [Hydrogenimonas sp.]